MAFLFLLLAISQKSPAQHLRIFACAIANDSAGAFMGGSSSGSGLYQSDDTGKTWKHLGWDNIKCYSMDMVQSSNGRILYEATGLGVLRSTDYGEHWKQITDWRMSEVMDVAVSQKNPKEIYVATAHGPWRTTDAGASWDKLNYPFNVVYCSRVKFDTASASRFFFAGERGLAEVSSNEWSVLSQVPAIRDIGRPGGDTWKPSVWFAASERNGILWLDYTGMFTVYDSLKRYPDMRAWCTSSIGSMTDTRMIGGNRGQILKTSDIDAGSSAEDTLIRNISACLLISENLELAGSLGQGVISTYPGSFETSESTLALRQVWTLKSFHVTP